MPTYAIAYALTKEAVLAVCQAVVQMNLPSSEPLSKAPLPPTRDSFHSSGIEAPLERGP
jgi:hypothetical protein